VNVRAERFPLMDSLRAIAATSVLAYHAAFFSGMYSSDSFLRPYVEHPSTGVSIFFVISAFLLYRPFVCARLAGEPAPSTGAYAWRRFLRIVPAYWIALTIIAIWLSLKTVFDPAWHIPLYYGFGQVYTSKTSLGGIGQAWTLCVEVALYAFLPLWAWAMRRRGIRTELVALAGLWVFSLGWKLVAIEQVDLATLGNGSLLLVAPNFLDLFAIGMALAIVSARGLSPAAERAVRSAWPWWLLAAVAYWVLSVPLGLRDHDPKTVFVPRHEMQSVLAVAVLAPAIFTSERRDRVRRLLAWRPLLYVGLVSYGVYLWHQALVQRIGGELTPWMRDTLGLGLEARFAVLFAVTLAAATSVATVSYYALERPLLRLKRLVGPEPGRGQPAEALAEPAPAVPGGGA
jgi:peptidoglycan/LPS O-acetylase OafA/YrhL